MSPVEDIIINKQAPQEKKGNKVILILILMLAILLIGSCGAYYWYTNIYETPKTAFFKYLGQTNIPEITDIEIYYNILDRMNNSNYETSTEANFTTTEKNDFTQNVDVSNFLFSVKTLSNKDTKEAYLGANILYKDNPFFDLEIISTTNDIAIGSSEVLDRYIATPKNSLTDSLNRTMGTETEITADTVDKDMKEFANNKISLDEEYRKTKATEYMTKIMEKVPEEAVTIAEASPITINSEVVNTKAYILALDENSYKDMVSSVLNTLKEDTDLLGKIVTGKEIEPPIVEEEVKTPKPITIQRVEGETVEHETAQEVETQETEEDSIPVNLDEEEEPISEEGPQLDILKPPEMDLLDTSDSPIFPMNFDSNEEGLEEEVEPVTEVEEDIFTRLIKAIVFGQKLDMSVGELQNKLEEEIQNLDINSGLEITVYVRDVENESKETIKVISKLSSTATLDIEYPENSKAKITFLDDVNTVDENGEEIIKNQGSSIEIKRANTEVETSFNIILNTIENQKVVGKLQLDITTKGTGTSKSYDNEIIIKNSDSEGDSKVNIKNSIEFKKTKLEKEINEENAIFIDRLSDEEASNLYANIMIRLMGIYSDKILNMNFVDVTGNEEDPNREVYSFGKSTADTLLPGQTFDDTDISDENTTANNTTEGSDSGTQNQPETPPITVTDEPQQPSTENNNNQPEDNNNNSNENTAVNVQTISKADVKNLLLKQIETMIGNAHNNNQEFTIKDLSNLPAQIEGMNVSSIITEERATIKIAGYTFYVDKDLMLTEE